MPMPPPRTTSATSVTAAIGAMCSAIRRASSSTTSPASASPARAAREDARASKGGTSASRRRPAASRAASAETAPAHGSISSPSPRATRSTSPAAPLRPRWSSPRRTSPAPRPVPTERKTKSSTPRATPRHCSPSAARLMSLSSVTGRPSRSAQLGREVAALEARDVRQPDRAARSRVDDARARRRPTLSSRSRRQSGRVDERRREASRSPSSAVPTSTSASSTSWRARTSPAQVADRPAQEPGAEVEAEHERRLGHRLEEDRAVARPARLRLGLADEAGLERGTAAPGRPSASRSRPAARSRRARSARRLRIVSNTVRSFRSLSSGGIAAFAVMSDNLNANRREFRRLTFPSRRVVGSPRSES